MGPARVRDIVSRPIWGRRKSQPRRGGERERGAGGVAARAVHGAVEGAALPGEGQRRLARGGGGGEARTVRVVGGGGGEGERGGGGDADGGAAVDGGDEELVGDAWRGLVTSCATAVCNRCSSRVQQVRQPCATGAAAVCNRCNSRVQQVQQPCATGAHGEWGREGRGPPPLEGPLHLSPSFPDLAPLEGEGALFDRAAREGRLAPHRDRPVPRRRDRPRVEPHLRNGFASA